MLRLHPQPSVVPTCLPLPVVPTCLALAPSSLVRLLRLITQGEAHGGSGMESSVLLGSSLPQAGPQQKQLFRSCTPNQNVCQLCLVQGRPGLWEPPLGSVQDLCQCRVLRPGPKDRRRRGQKSSALPQWLKDFTSYDIRVWGSGRVSYPCTTEKGSVLNFSYKHPANEKEYVSEDCSWVRGS